MKKVLLVLAHPEPQSLNALLAQAARDELQAQGHRAVVSDLYALGWKAHVDAADFPDRLDPARLDVIAESGHAWKHGSLTADVRAEQAKLLEADAVVFQFPLWWFGMPAIMKGWIERVFAYGLAYGWQDAGNRYRYGEGGLAGQRQQGGRVGVPERDALQAGLLAPGLDTGRGQLPGAGDVVRAQVEAEFADDAGGPPLVVVGLAQREAARGQVLGGDSAGQGHVAHAGQGGGRP